MALIYLVNLQLPAEGATIADTINLIISLRVEWYLLSLSLSLSLLGTSIVEGTLLPSLQSSPSDEHHFVRVCDSEASPSKNTIVRYYSQQIAYLVSTGLEAGRRDRTRKVEYET